jgi:hypothetical protein
LSPGVAAAQRVVKAIKFASGAQTRFHFAKASILPVQPMVLVSKRLMSRDRRQVGVRTANECRDRAEKLTPHAVAARGAD